MKTRLTLQFVNNVLDLHSNIRVGLHCRTIQSPTIDRHAASFTIPFFQHESACYYRFR